MYSNYTPAQYLNLTHTKIYLKDKQTVKKKAICIKEISVINFFFDHICWFLMQYLYQLYPVLNTIPINTDSILLESF